MVSAEPSVCVEAEPAPGWCFAALERCRARYLACACRILDCPALSEDVVQDVMLRLAGIAPVPRPDVQVAYVARMVRNLAIDRARRRRLERRLFEGIEAAQDEPASEEATPERTIALRESLRLAQAALASLPEPARTVFRLHRIEGVPQKVIAARLGVSRALVCGLVRRGHLHCLAALEGRCRAPACAFARRDEDRQGGHRIGFPSSPA